MSSDVATCLPYSITIAVEWWQMHVMAMLVCICHGLVTKPLWGEICVHGVHPPSHLAHCGESLVVKSLDCSWSPLYTQEEKEINLEQQGGWSTVIWCLLVVPETSLSRIWITAYLSQVPCRAVTKFMYRWRKRQEAYAIIEDNNDELFATGSKEAKGEMQDSLMLAQQKQLSQNQ